MNNLKAKLKKAGGFTLIEMLIVVAIIAILIAIGIPLVNKALERAREATDSANERSAIGLAMVEVMTENKLGGQAIADAAVSAAYKIDPAGTGGQASSLGTLVEIDSNVGAGKAGFNYGKGTKLKGESEEVHTNGYIKVTYDPTATTEAAQYKVEWVTS